MSDNFIFQPKTNCNASKNKEENIFYTLIGLSKEVDDQNNQITTPESKNVFAKKILHADDSVRFYIRTGNNGNIHNPISVYGEEKINNFLERVCKDTIRFREVNEKVFSFYLKFLNTKNIAWLNNAEREII